MTAKLRSRRFMIGIVGSVLGLPLFLIFLTSAAMAAETKSSEQLYYTVNRAKQAPIVDGVLDDPAWEDVESQRLEWEVTSAISWTDSLDFDGSFQALWRDGNLYVALKLRDDVLHVNPRDPSQSDRIELFLPNQYGQSERPLTIPVHEVSSIEDPDIPFVAWSADGSVCEFSIETDAMYSRPSELRINIHYVDVDPGEPAQRIGWVPQWPGARDPQLGTFQFQKRPLDLEAVLETTWGRMKALY